MRASRREVDRSWRNWRQLQEKEQRAHWIYLDTRRAYEATGRDYRPPTAKEER